MDEQHCKTPTGEEELQLMLAGLGKRSLALTESTTHTEESYEHDLSPEKTAECPVCRKDFNINVIEAHASGCGLRSAAHEGNRKTSALSLNSFQSLEEILEWVTLQVDDGGTFSIVVSRDDLYTRAMMQWQRQKRSSPKHRLRVSFFGEDGIDTGALSKEFFTEMIAEIENKLFVGGADKKGKNPLYCLSSLDQNHFRTAGEMMVASVAQGGPPPNFMREWCYKYLTTQTDSDSMHVSVSDVTDPELVQLITEVNSATDDSIHTLIDSIVNCGFTGKISCVNKDAIVRAIVLHATTRVVPMLDQLRKGMELYNMKKVLQAHADLCQPLFVPTEDDELGCDSQLFTYPTLH
ncbi:hypothetical protein AALO_G00122090 [Alosa alosa]|uniref:HECT domain-containing protein n=1 Tax=Alosa alosa TaxID=278164 RepID=A0AAV6GL85_9TELE|nr:hypothetical protein AALO_G00122090 [Alosa alosa]